MPRKTRLLAPRGPKSRSARKAPSPPEPAWTFTDGWILMALLLAHGKEGALRRDILATADVINHAVPTAQELSSTLRKLTACGVVALVGHRHVIASGFLPSLRRAYQGRGGLFSSADKGVKWLRAAKLIPVLPRT